MTWKNARHAAVIMMIVSAFVLGLMLGDAEAGLVKFKAGSDLSKTVRSMDNVSPSWMVEFNKTHLAEYGNLTLEPWTKDREAYFRTAEVGDVTIKTMIERAHKEGCQVIGRVGHF